MAEQPKIKPKDDQRKRIQDVEPWILPDLTPEQIGAIRAVSRGTADAHQQVLAFQFLIDLSHNGGAHFFPGQDGQRSTDFALGRAWVGKVLVTMCKMIIRPGNEQG